MITKYINSQTSSSPLAIFRILFGLQMIISLSRFWLKGWIKSTYVDPTFHFKYYGFEFIECPGLFIYALFFICIISALFISLGFKYRISAVIFFLSFTYIELIDKATYLNHYYFISIVSFIMIFLPANSRLSVDSKLKKCVTSTIPRWNIDIIKLMLLIVYFYAGIGKINSDWLIDSKPLAIWLPAKYDLPLIGSFLTKYWVAKLMSWCGMIFDVFIGFFLFAKKTKHYAYFFVVVFHLMTAFLFPSIGMFPFIMITSTTIYLTPKLHDSVVNYFESCLNFSKKRLSKKESGNLTKIILVSVIILQLLIPLRYKLYNGEVFWNEEGYRFSWRVMLVEKVGLTNFTITGDNNKRVMVNNEDYLTPFQEKQMSFQPDMILEFAHFLGRHYESMGFNNPKVTVDCFVSFNGRLSTRLIRPQTNLLDFKGSFSQKSWVIPFSDEISRL